MRFAISLLLALCAAAEAGDWTTNIYPAHDISPRLVVHYGLTNRYAKDVWQLEACSGVVERINAVGDATNYPYFANPPFSRREAETHAAILNRLMSMLPFASQGPPSGIDAGQWVDISLSDQYYTAPGQRLVVDPTNLVPPFTFSTWFAAHPEATDYPHLCPSNIAALLGVPMDAFIGPSYAWTPKVGRSVSLATQGWDFVRDVLCLFRAVSYYGSFGARPGDVWQAGFQAEGRGGGAYSNCDWEFRCDFIPPGPDHVPWECVIISGENLQTASVVSVYEDIYSYLLGLDAELGGPESYPVVRGAAQSGRVVLHDSTIRFDRLVVSHQAAMIKADSYDDGVTCFEHLPVPTNGPVEVALGFPLPLTNGYNFSNGLFPGTAHTPMTCSLPGDWQSCATHPRSGWNIHLSRILLTYDFKYD